MQQNLSLIDSIVDKLLHIPMIWSITNKSLLVIWSIVDRLQTLNLNFVIYLNTLGLIIILYIKREKQREKV